MAKAPGIKTAERLLAKYPREILLMRSQMQQRRLGLVLGAGFSKSLDFPDWNDFLDTIADQPEINMRVQRANHRHLKKGETLYQVFRQETLKCDQLRTFLSDQGLTSLDTEYAQSLANAYVDSRWLDLLNSTLYSQYPDEPSKRKARLLSLARKSYHRSLIHSFDSAGAVIINYNFDDSVEIILDSLDKIPHSTWLTSPMRTPTKVTVHHPNGYLPRDRSRGSNSVTLLESSFQNHIQDAVTGAYASYAAYLLENTCLFIGVSLDDPGLTHHLHQASVSRPGQVHFLVVFKGSSYGLDVREETSIRLTLYELYNVITLFLDESELSTLSKVLREDDFDKVASEALIGLDELKFNYYITGCVSVGKSTVLSHLNGLQIYGEWTADMPKEMKDDPSGLTTHQRTKIEKWVNLQVARKNLQAHGASSGLNIFDRCPLDAFAFTPKSEWATRARSMRGNLSAKGQRPLAGGRVLLLIGDPYEMCVRSVVRDKGVTQQWLEAQQASLLEVYRSLDRGVKCIDTRGRSLRSVVKDVVRAIFFEEYEMADLDASLSALEKITV